MSSDVKCEKITKKGKRCKNYLSKDPKAAKQNLCTRHYRLSLLNESDSEVSSDTASQVKEIPINLDIQALDFLPISIFDDSQIYQLRQGSENYWSDEYLQNWKANGHYLVEKPFSIPNSLGDRNQYFQTAFSWVKENPSLAGSVTTALAAGIYVICTMVFYMLVGFGFRFTGLNDNEIGSVLAGTTIFAVAGIVLATAQLQKRDKERFEVRKELMISRKRADDARNSLEFLVSDFSNKISFYARYKQTWKELLRQAEIEQKPSNPNGFLSIKLNNLFIQYFGKRWSLTQWNEIVTDVMVKFPDKFKLSGDKNSTPNSRIRLTKLLIKEIDEDLRNLKRLRKLENAFFEVLNRYKKLEERYLMHTSDQNKLDRALVFRVVRRTLAVFVGGLGLVSITAVLPSKTNQCDGFLNWFVSCYDLEVRTADDKYTHHFSPALVYGRSGDRMLLKTKGSGSDWVAREIPESKIVQLQMKRDSAEFIRLGEDPPNKNLETPVKILHQENHFETTKLLFDIPASSYNLHENFASNFFMPSYQLEKQNIDLSIEVASNYFIDGRRVAIFDDSNYHHIIIPFFNEQIAAEASNPFLKEMFTFLGTAGIDHPIEAFVAGFNSFQDAPIVTETGEVESYLGILRNVLSRCVPKGQSLEVAVYGYASKRSFKVTKRDPEYSLALNLALAEGRRFAVVDQITKISSNNSPKKIVLANKTAILTPDFHNFLRFLKEEDLDQMGEFLSDPNKVDSLMRGLKDDLFRFENHEEMFESLEKTLNYEVVSNASLPPDLVPLLEAFERSAVLLVPKDAIENCVRR